MYDNTFPTVNYEVLEQPLHILKCRRSSGLTLCEISARWVILKAELVCNVNIKHRASKKDIKIGMFNAILNKI